MSKFNIESAKTKTPLSMRWAQMSKQEQIIEKKKMEIQAKVEAQRKAAHAAKLMSKADEVKGNKATAANIFSNDGSFLDQFKKLVESTDPPPETTGAVTIPENKEAEKKSLEETSLSAKPAEPNTPQVTPTPTDKPKEQTRGEEIGEQRRDYKNNDRRFDRGDRSQRHWNASNRASGGSLQQDNKQYPQQTPPKLPIPSLMQNPIMPPGMRHFSPAPPNMNSPMYQNNRPFSPMQNHPNDSGNNQGAMGNAKFPSFPPPFNMPRPNFMPPLPGQTNAPPPVNNAPMLPPPTPPSFLSSNVPPTNLPPPPTNFSTGPPNFSSSVPTPSNFSTAPAPPNFSSASSPPNFSSTPAPPNFSSPAHPNFPSALTPPNFTSPAPLPCNIVTQPPPFPFMMPPNFHNPTSSANMPFVPPLPPNPVEGNVGRINQKSSADSMALPPPQPELHTIPPPGMLKQFPKAELDICNIPPPQIAVLSADTRVTPAMEDAAKQVARSGPLWENMLKSRQDSALWFLQDEKSLEYNMYQSLVTRYRNELMEEQQKRNEPSPIPKEEKYDPEFSLHDEDSGDGYNDNNRFEVKPGNDRQDGEYDYIRSGGFNNRTDDRFDNKRDGGFGNRTDGGFNNRMEGGFDNRNDDGFGNRRDDGFDNRRDDEFNSRWAGGMDNKRDARFENRRDDGFDNRRGSGFDNRKDSGFDRKRGGRFDDRRDSCFDSREGGEGGGFDNRMSGRSGDGRDDGFDNKRDSDFDYRRDTKFDNRRDTDFDNNRRDSQPDTKSLIGFGSHQGSNLTNRADSSFGNKRDVKRERKNSDSDEDTGNKAERRKKRKSRWGEGDAQSTDVGLPGVACISGLGGAVVPTIVPTLLPGVAPPSSLRPGDPMLLSRVTRSDPALLQYARMNYGSTSLTEEEWGKCEDNYKLNLLYQDMMRKKQELEKLAMAGRNKHEYDSDEDTDQGTWEHKLRAAEIEATKQWATELTKRAAGKHHIGDFLPPEELKKFMEKYSAIKSGKEPDLSDYKEFKLGEDNIGFQMLQKLGWNQGHGLGAEGTGIVEPVNKASQRDTKQGLGMASMEDLAAGDDEFDAYRKRMMMAYRFRPNPLNNPRRPYY